MCCNRKVIKGVNDIATTHPKLLKYFIHLNDAYTKTHSSKDKVELKCPICGNRKHIHLYSFTARGFRCNVCGGGLSYPNRLMACILHKLGVEFVSEYNPKWAVDERGKQRRYDFYIPSKSLIIEMDGGFHEKDNNMSGQTRQEAKSIDDWKDKVAKEHDLNVIRIDCVESRIELIKDTILKSSLKKYIDVSDIDWGECEQICRCSMVRQVCDLWNDSNCNTASEFYLQNKCNISVSYSTVIEYLKIGNDISLCEYNAKSSMQHVYSNSHARKPIIVTKDGDIVGGYESISDFVRKNNMKNGVRFSNASISDVCNGKRSEYRGYGFSFKPKAVDDLQAWLQNQSK